MTSNDARRMTRRRVLGTLAAIASAPRVLAQSPATPTQPSAWPVKPLRVVVPYAAGGGADNSARLFAQAIAPALGQSVVVENRPGASGVLAASFVAQAPGDGYTVLFDAFAAAVNAVTRKLPYDFLHDLTPVSQVVDAPSVMVVRTQSPWTSVTGFVEHARANAGKVSYASYGAGGVAHLAGELLKNQARLDMIHVPYKGGAPAMTDLVGGQIDTYFANTSSALGHIRAGRLRPLAVTSAERVGALPDVPTFTELGYRDFVILDWNGFFLPGTTPAPIVERLSTVCREAARSATVRERLAGVGLVPVGNTPEQFRRFLGGQMKMWGDLVTANRITVE